MPWIVGVDEAGYGPNLGPLVVSSVAVFVEDGADQDLWRRLDETVCRAGEAPNGRLVIDDSKRVYAGSKGLHELERASLAPHLPELEEQLTVERLLQRIGPDAVKTLKAEAWYDSDCQLPLTCPLANLGTIGQQLRKAGDAKGVRIGPVRSVTITPSDFNEIVARTGTKAAALAIALKELIQWNRTALPAAEPIEFTIDRHGGRHFYAAQLNDACPYGWLHVESENANCSRYRMDDCGRPLTWSFLPRADSGHICVAWASMVSKYLREVYMQMFNRYWQRLIPEIKPTAGYPGDSARFLDSIRPILQRQCVPEHHVWRAR